MAVNIYYECKDAIQLVALSAMHGHIKFHTNKLPQHMYWTKYMENQVKILEKRVLDGSDSVINKIDDFIKIKNDTTLEDIKYFGDLIKSYFAAEYISSDVNLINEFVDKWRAIFKKKYLVLDRQDNTDKKYYIHLWPRTHPVQIRCSSLIKMTVTDTTTFLDVKKYLLDKFKNKGVVRVEFSGICCRDDLPLSSEFTLGYDLCSDNSHIKCELYCA